METPREDAAAHAKRAGVDHKRCAHPIASGLGKSLPHSSSMPMPEDDEIPEVVEHPIGPELDLHTFRPDEIGSLLPEYFRECRQRGILRVRIVHGKGRGTLRTGVHHLLGALPEVQHFTWPADESSGSWGATWVVLRQTIPEAASNSR
jgi:hypothetical protein